MRNLSSGSLLQISGGTQLAKKILHQSIKNWTPNSLHVSWKAHSGSRSVVPKLGVVSPTNLITAVRLRLEVRSA